MFRIFFIILLALVFFPMMEAKALSDGEYKILMKSSQFKKADQELTESWNDLYLSPNISKSDRKFLLNDQRNWLRKERDIEAHKLQALGINKIDAYTIVTFERAGVLWVHSYNMMNEVGKENPKSDGYYSYNMMKKALKTIKEAGGDSNFLAKTLGIDLSDIE